MSVASVAEFCDRLAPLRVLDVACGIGTQALGLAGRFYQPGLVGTRPAR